MNAPETHVPCSACGTTLPRSEMFGVEPLLLCPACASGVRQRMQIRVRPTMRERKPVVTVLWLATSVVLFVLTDFVYPARGATPRPAWLNALYQAEPIWVGEVWRHLTCMLLHGGWWHILLNGFAIWFLGRMIEMGWGHWAMAGLMVGTGLAASAVEWIMQGGGVGLSGGLFGLCGFMWALRRVHPVAGAVMHDQQIRWILTLLVVGVVLSATGRLAVGNWAHGAGLVSGFAIGLAVRSPRRRLWVPACSLGVVLLVVLSVYVALGKAQMNKGQTWTRAHWRTYWIEHYNR